MHIHERLWQLFLQSNPQQQAVASLVSELQRYELIGNNLRAWRTFVDDYVTQISLFGFCVYQVVRGLPEVLNGRHVELQRRGRRLRPKLLPNVPRKSVRTKNWQLLVVREPIMADSGLYLYPMSPAFKCLAQTSLRLRLELNLEQREQVNSVPAVYTRIQNNIASAPGSTRPWFTHGQMAGDVSQRVDLDELVQHRADTIRALDRITDNALRVEPHAVPGEPPSASGRQHVEHAITDGRDITEARTLPHDGNIVHHTIDRLAHEIQFAFGVPPQVQGRNINSERMASSNRLNEQAIVHFRATAQRLKHQLDEIFTESGEVKYGDQANAHTLDQIGHLLKPDKLIKLYALANNIDESYFDKNQVKESRSLPEKKQKTDEDKLKAALSRNPKDG